MTMMDRFEKSWKWLGANVEPGTVWLAVVCIGLALDGWFLLAGVVTGTRCGHTDYAHWTSSVDRLVGWATGTRGSQEMQTRRIKLHRRNARSILVIVGWARLLNITGLAFTGLCVTIALVVAVVCCIIADHWFLSQGVDNVHMADYSCEINGNAAGPSSMPSPPSGLFGLNTRAAGSPLAAQCNEQPSGDEASTDGIGKEHEPVCTSSPSLKDR